ncbi:hypothetical protein ACFX13_019925 [Malus domestica]
MITDSKPKPSEKKKRREIRDGTFQFYPLNCSAIPNNSQFILFISVPQATTSTAKPLISSAQASSSNNSPIIGVSKSMKSTPIQQIPVNQPTTMSSFAARSVLRSSAARTTVASRLASVPRIQFASLPFSIPLGLHKHTLTSVLVSCDRRYGADG